MSDPGTPAVGSGSRIIDAKVIVTCPGRNFVTLEADDCRRRDRRR